MPISSKAANISRFGLGPQVDTRTVPDNPWLAVLEHDAFNVLAAISSTDPIAFAFTQSSRLQAGADTPSRQILVSGNLGFMMCRLCAAIVEAGIFTLFGGTSVNWMPRPASSATVQDCLANDSFEWSAALSTWAADPERQQIFAFLLIQIHRFVLLHEAAHIRYRHGETKSGQPLDIPVDGSRSSEKSEDAAASSMARELIADADAFRLHFMLLDQQFTQEHTDEMSANLANHLVGTPAERLRMTFLSAFLVFQLLDRGAWTAETARLATHPPAPFRMKAIYAAALNLRHPSLTSKEIESEIACARFLGSAVTDVGLNRLPQLGWIGQVDGPEFDVLFSRIYAQMPRWRNTAPV